MTDTRQYLKALREQQQMSATEVASDIEASNTLLYESAAIRLRVCLERVGRGA